MKYHRNNMSRIQLSLACLCWAILATISSGLRAQDKTPADLVSPYLDETTLGVAWCDVEQLDILAIASLAKNYNVPVDESAYSYATEVVKGLKQTGVQKVYCVLDVGSLMESRPPLFILQTKPGADLSVVQALVTPFLVPADISVAKDGEVLLLGTKKILERKQGHPAVKSERLQKQMAAANKSNAICIAPSASLAEALRMTMGIGAGEGDKQPAAVKMLMLFAPMEGMRINSTTLHEGVHASVDFDSPEKANRFKKDLGLVLQEVEKIDVEKVLPQVKDSSAVWALEDGARFSEFIKGFAKQLSSGAVKGTSANNMRQIALALHNHESAFTILPPQAVVSPDGKRLLSWRVLLLPFLDRNDLYDRFKLDEPWDSANNAALIKEMPKFFARPGSDPTLGKTPYVAPLMKESFFGRPGAPPAFKDILDGTSNTIWIIEAPAEFEVTWTKPDDWEVKGVESIQVFLKANPELLVSMMDGSVITLPATVTADTILKMFTIAGGEVVSFE